MKVKIIKVRISEKEIAADQKNIDNFLKNKEILKVETAFVQDGEKESFWSVIVFYEEPKFSINETKPHKYTVADEDLKPDEIAILDSLKIWRSKKAKEQNLPSYFIATNQELVSVAKFRPVKKEELLEIKGFGKHKIEHYGEEIIEILERV